MATYYVYSGAGGSNTGGSWANAYTAFGSAVTAATTDGDVILVHYTHQESLSADTTYTFSAAVSVYSVDKDSADAPTPMGSSGWIGHASTAYSISVQANANDPLFLYGLSLRVSGAGGPKLIKIGNNGDGQIIYLDSVNFRGNTTNNGFYISLGASGVNNANSFIRAKNCTFRFGHASQYIRAMANAEIIGGSIDSAGTAPTVNIFSQVTSVPAGGYFRVVGFDASHAGSCPLVGDCTSMAVVFDFVDCKLGSGYVPLASQTSAEAGAVVTIYNCSSSDSQYEFGYHTALGSCVAYTAIRANDGPSYDGTNTFSWRIDTSALVTMTRPFVTPWISTYHDGTSAITPSVEILRDGSATAYDNDEVWGEFSYQGTTGYPISTIVDDRMALLGTPAAQTTGSLSGTGWTGENATSWFGKVNPTATITPAEIGELRARICVGVASATVYVDPQIRT